MEFLKNHKYKVIGAVVVFFLGIALYFGFEQYAYQIAACESNGGQIIYNKETGIVECVTNDPYWKSWWPF